MNESSVKCRDKAKCRSLDMPGPAVGHATVGFCGSNVSTFWQSPAASQGFYFGQLKAFGSSTGQSSDTVSKDDCHVKRGHRVQRKEDAW